MKTTDSIITRDLDVALDFRNVTTEDIPLLQRQFQRHPSRSCDFTVGGVLIWTELYDYKITFVDDTLLIRGRDPETGAELFYAPVGDMESEDFRNLVDAYCKSLGITPTYIMPEERVVEKDADIADEEAGYARGWLEYLYEAERFATFAGRKMEKKRCHLHFFENNYSPYEVEEITAENVGELITFTLAFELSHNDSALAEYEASQIIEVLRNYHLYPFTGIALRKDGKIIGYSFGEKSGDTFVIHAEKGDIAYRGLYQALSSHMAQKALELYPDIRYLNREDDMGMESLRRSKLSYHPSVVIAKKID